MNSQPILYVEDDANEVVLLRYAFEAAGVRNPLHVVGTGNEAQNYLSDAARPHNGEAHLLPCLVLLDLNLPGMSGLDLLEWIRAQPALTTLIVILYTGSRNPHELARAYRLRVNSFISKPDQVAMRIEFARLLKAWWLEHNQVPEMEAQNAPLPVNGATKQGVPDLVSTAMVGAGAASALEVERSPDGRNAKPEQVTDTENA